MLACVSTRSCRIYSHLLPTLRMSSSTSFALVVLSKLVFLFCIVMQCVLLPCTATILVCCLHGLWALTYYFNRKRADIIAELSVPGLFLIAPNKDRKAYTHMVVMVVYFFVFFLVYSDETMRHIGSMMPWIPPVLFGNYSVTGEVLKGVDVTSALSAEMRKHTFVWPREYTGAAPVVQGVLPYVGQQGVNVHCPAWAAVGANTSAFQCYGKFIDATDSLPPRGVDWVGAHPFVPLPSQLYDVDLQVSPPAGMACEALEVYRVVLDRQKVPMVPLDYPSSSVATGTAAEFLEQCGLFGNGEWCLGQKHTFTKQAYTTALAAQCTKYGGHLVMRLPTRFADVDVVTGYMAADVLLVTAGAEVTLHATWNVVEDSNKWYMAPFKLLSQYSAAQWLRDSDDAYYIFLKFFVSITPPLMLWYYLALYYSENPRVTQISFLCIFVLIPSVCLFLSVGAYVPLSGALLVLVAVNYPPVTANAALGPHVRPLLLFITAASNSVEFAWIVALTAQAGWSAFYYELTLEQLYNLSYQFVVTDASSPTWVALFMPTVLMATFMYLIGCSLCVVMETLANQSRSKH